MTATPPTNTTVRERARNYWWNPAQPVLRNIGRVALNVLRSGGNPLVAAGQMASSIAMGEAREGLGNAWRGRGGNSTPFSPSGAPLPAWMTPGATGETGWNPNTPGAYGPVYNQDQQGAGPPRIGENTVLANGPLPQRGPVGPQRNNNTIAEGDAAVDWARGLSMANSGLNASGGSFDRLNNYANNIQR